MTAPLELVCVVRLSIFRSQFCILNPRLQIEKAVFMENNGVLWVAFERLNNSWVVCGIDYHFEVSQPPKIQVATTPLRSSARG